MSTNKPSISSVVLEIALELLENKMKFQRFVVHKASIHPGIISLIALNYLQQYKILCQQLVDIDLLCCDWQKVFVCELLPSNVNPEGIHLATELGDGLWIGYLSCKYSFLVQVSVQATTDQFFSWFYNFFFIVVLDSAWKMHINDYTQPGIGLVVCEIAP